MSTITNVTYPTTAVGYLEFDMTAGSFFFDGSPNWNPIVAIEFSGSDRSVAYQEANFLGSFRARSTVTGVGTVASPLHFKIRPERWPTNRGITLVPRPVDLEIGSGAATPSIPSGWEQRSPYRDYDTLHVTTLANLVANPTVRSRAGWSALEAMVIMTELAPSNLANYASIKANAALLSPAMRVFPGHRVGAHHTPAAVQVDATGSFLFSDWCSLSRWQAMADLWRDHLIPLCDVDDPRVYISAENYSSTSSAEPTVDNLVAAGFTEAQFMAACDPFVQLMHSTGRVCLIAPMALGTANGMHLLAKRLIQVCGADYVHPIWETQADYGLSYKYREGTGTSYLVGVVAGAQQPNLMDQVLGVRACHRRACSDELLRESGALGNSYVVPSGDWGRYAPWIESVCDTDLANYGKPGMVNGTYLDSSNDVEYDFRMPPSYADTSFNPTSVGHAATPLVIQIFRSNVQTSLGTAGGGQQFNDYDGWRISPQGSNIYAAWRTPILPPSGNAAQYTWTVLGRFKIPAALATTTPLFGQAEVNIGTWQVYYDAGDDTIKLKCVGAAASTIMSAPARDTVLHVMVARASATSFKHGYRGSAITTISASSTTAYQYVIFGGGQEVATFPTNNKIQSTNNFVGQELASWWRTLTDAEMARHLNGQYPLSLVRL